MKSAQGSQAESGGEDTLQLLRLGYFPTAVRVTKVNVRPAGVKYKAYLPDRFNDIWAGLRKLGKVEVYADVPQDIVAKAYPLMNGSRFFFRARIMRQAVDSSKETPNKERYVIMLPTMYARLWEVAHRAGAMLRLYFNINGGSEGHGSQPQGNDNPPSPPAHEDHKAAPEAPGSTIRISQLELLETLCKLFGSNKFTTSQVAKALGLSMANAHQRLDRLRARGLVEYERGNGRGRWRLAAPCDSFAKQRTGSGFNEHYAQARTGPPQGKDSHPSLAQGAEQGRPAQGGPQSEPNGPRHAVRESQLRLLKALRELFGDSEFTTGGAARALGLSKSDVSHRLAILEMRGLLVKSGRGRWRLAGSALELLTGKAGA